MRQLFEDQTNEADFQLRKREQFAISLRKKKKQEIIAIKRKKTMDNLSKQKFSSIFIADDQKLNSVVPDFLQSPEMVGFVLD